jgi:hypothetical protein
MIYRWLLRLYPHDFRRQYQDELEADFESLRQEALAAGGRKAVLKCYGHAAGDLVRSALREWLRTPWLPVLIAAGIIAVLVFYYVVGRVYRARSFASGTQPPESPELLLLMAAMVLIPIAVMALVGVAARLVSVKPRERRRRV